MSKKDKARKEPLGLKEILSAAEKRRQQDDILEMKKPYLESERVLYAENTRTIHEISRHVKACDKVFVTPDHPDLAPILPAGFGTKFKVPTDVTPPRERAYFQDRGFLMRDLQCEVRQEFRIDGYKQTTKVGGNATKIDPTMDRMEQASKLLSFGFNVYAIGDKQVRDALLSQATSQGKPVLRMISQRERIPYHPEGDPDILIEMALEPIHVGETFTGHRWLLPKIDLEIKIGPDKEGLRHSLLAFEQKRLCKIFPLKQQLFSSPTEGFEAIEAAMETDAGRSAFDKLKTREKWWEEGTAPLVPRMRA